MIHKKKRIVYTTQTVNKVVDYLAQLSEKPCLFALTGTLGAGKTTLTQMICARLGVQGIVSSPTFSYLNIYKTVKNDFVYHFDLYRIDSLDTFLLMGFQEYLRNPKAWVIIEWPEVIAPILQEKVCFIHLNYVDYDSRVAEIIEICEK